MVLFQSCAPPEECERKSWSFNADKLAPSPHLTTEYILGCALVLSLVVFQVGATSRGVVSHQAYGIKRLARCLEGRLFAVNIPFLF